MRAQRYLIAVLLAMVAFFVLALAVSLVADPFGVSPLRKSVPGLNAVRMLRTQNDRLVRPYDPIVRPAALIIMGSSRIKQGIDPAYASKVSGLSVYNAGVDNQPMFEKATLAAHYIDHARGLKHLYMELWGNFQTLPVWASVNPMKPEEHASAMLRLFLSGSAQLAALETLHANAIYPRPGPGTPPFAGLSGYFDAAGHPCANCAIDDFVDKGWRGLDLNPTADDLLVPLLRDIRQRAARKGIEVRYFLSPFHASFLYASEASGHWAALEEIKRRLAKVGGVYDFLRYNKFTEEPPAKEMQFWKEAWHFKPILGEAMVQAMLGSRADELPANFGRLLEAKTVEAEISAFRAERDGWIARHPEIVKRYREAAKQGRP